MSDSYKKKLYIVIMALIVVAFIMGIWLLKPKEKNIATRPTSSVTTAQSNTQPMLANTNELSTPNLSATGPLSKLAPSLQGTQIDCPLEVDQKGQLILTNGIRRCFDYFFSTLGEKSEQQLIVDIRQYLTVTLPNTALPYALYLLKQYVSYRHAEAPTALKEKTNSPDSFQAALIALKNLRLKFFTSLEAQAFFGDEEAYDQYNIDVMRITNDATLTKKEKDEKIAALMEQLPSSLAENMNAVQKYNILQQKTKEIQARGGSAQELYAMRQTIVGTEAAERLAKLDKEEADWNQRLSNYLIARERIKKSTSDKINQQQAVDALRNQTFSAPEERIRAQVYETMRDNGDNRIF
jgi:lipase chaperone LimK